MNKVLIYIPLLDEGTSVCRPTEGEEVSDLVFRVLPTPDYDPGDENWAYPPGTLVRCHYGERSGTLVLVAVEKV